MLAGPRQILWDEQNSCGLSVFWKFSPRMHATYIFLYQKGARNGMIYKVEKNVFLLWFLIPSLIEEKRANQWQGRYFQLFSFDPAKQSFYVNQTSNLSKPQLCWEGTQGQSHVQASSPRTSKNPVLLPPGASFPAICKCQWCVCCWHCWCWRCFCSGGTWSDRSKGVWHHWMGRRNGLVIHSHQGLPLFGTSKSFPFKFTCLELGCYKYISVHAT